MIEQLYERFLETQKICTDTRNIIQDAIFFALKGPNFNANAFAYDALKAGAAYAVIDEETGIKDDRLIKVENSLFALQQLAQYHRRQLKIPVIAVTGSNGKTTTKELIRCVLAEKFRVLATTGNLNNHIGVPLTLLSITTDITAAVVEMGANHQKEIELLCNIAEPTHGLITNVGKAHLEGFGGFDGVIKGKTEMYHYLKNNNGVIFCNHDNQYLLPHCDGYSSVFYYGTTYESDIIGKLVSDETYVNLNWNAKNSGITYYINSQIAGSYNLENILAAVAVGYYFKVEPEKINNAIASYVPSNQRSQLIQMGTTTIMLDAYNANPTSMREAILNFNKNFNAPKWVILGDMFELGESENTEHGQLIELIRQCNFDQVILVGERFARHKNAINANFFENSKSAANWLAQQNTDGISMLVKGSRGSRMELVLPQIAA